MSGARGDNQPLTGPGPDIHFSGGGRAQAAMENGGIAQ